MRIHCRCDKQNCIVCTTQRMRLIKMFNEDKAMTKQSKFCVGQRVRVMGPIQVNDGNIGSPIFGHNKCDKFVVQTVWANGNIEVLQVSGSFSCAPLLRGWVHQRQLIRLKPKPRTRVEKREMYINAYKNSEDDRAHNSRQGADTRRTPLRLGEAIRIEYSVEVPIE